MKKVPAKKSKKGFTLIELVVVIAILGILAAILIPVISGFITRANIAKDQANARSLFNSLAMFVATEDGEQSIDGVLTATFTDGIEPLFGTIPDTIVVSAKITADVVEEATYNEITYYRDATGVGFK